MSTFSTKFGLPDRAIGFGFTLRENAKISLSWENLDVPFIDDEIWIKQLNMVSLNDLGQRALSFAFSGFTDSDESFSTVNEFYHKMNEFVNFHWDASITRRFAGDSSLPRGRYFTLCDEVGNDGGTLIRELRTYYNPFKSGIIQIFDLTNENDYRMLSRSFGGIKLDRHNIVLFIPDIEGIANPFLQHLIQIDQLKNSNKLNVGYAVFLPLVVKKVRFKRIIDLRKQDVAEWFTRQFSSLKWNLGGEKPIELFPHRAPLKTFQEILPEVLAQEIGGGGFSKAVGIFLRQIGTDALIYPSARLDAKVEILDGEVKFWCGWNLVDYTNSHETRYLAWTEFGELWPEKIGIRPGPESTNDKSAIWFHDVKIAFEKMGRKKGSWEILGLKSRRDAHWIYNLAQYAMDAQVGKRISKKSRDIVVAWLISYLDKDMNSVGGFSRLVFDVVSAGDIQAKTKMLHLAEHLKQMDEVALASAMVELTLAR